MLNRQVLNQRCYVSLRKPAALLRHSSTLRLNRSQLNQSVIDMLHKHRELEENNPTSNVFKIQAYDNAIFAVTQLQFPIRSANDVQKVQGIGRSIAAKINEHFLADPTLQELDPPLYREMLKAQIVKEINALPGIGSATAKKLVEAGCTSPEDLKLPQFFSMLTAKQIAKIKYPGLPAPIQRQDAQNVLAFCRDSFDSQYEFTLVGEYRRGFMTLPDIQIMVAHPDFVHIPLLSAPPPEQSLTSTQRARGKRKKVDEISNILHSDVIPGLQQRGLIAEAFSSNNKSWEGMIRLPGSQNEWGSSSDRAVAINNLEGEFRKMKIHIVPQMSQGASLICLTGDADFEKDISYRARQRSMLFNEYGLWKWTSSPSETTPISTDADTHSKSHSFWSLINSSTEDDIFKQLGMVPIDPTRRNFSYIISKPRKKRTTINTAS